MLSWTCKGSKKVGPLILMAQGLNSGGFGGRVKIREKHVYGFIRWVPEGTAH